MGKEMKGGQGVRGKKGREHAHFSLICLGYQGKSRILPVLNMARARAWIKARDA